eukprot:TRINITY_DN123721_c0_g1_i1.p1 TRINITY_DN123721_c0_g1~~TRINITY_DN123721_c0_g1_i1.p1  ORF type:complete len:167 (+),score=29.43 TRINITY_DN123721_c0_g1_i1:110-610(+)
MDVDSRRTVTVLMCNGQRMQIEVGPDAFIFEIAVSVNAQLQPDAPCYVELLQNGERLNVVESVQVISVDDTPLLAIAHQGHEAEAIIESICCEEKSQGPAELQAAMTLLLAIQNSYGHLAQEPCSLPCVLLERLNREFQSCCTPCTCAPPFAADARRRKLGAVLTF